MAADGSGFFADEGGFVFPLQSRVQVEVPQIEGRLPLSVGKGYKGRLTDEKERRWLLGVIQLVRYVQSSKVWNGRIEKIGVNDKGEITLKSTEGKERFLFGKPDGLAEKFARVETYYRTIAPSREPGWYSSVNVQYAGQIICRK